MKPYEPRSKNPYELRTDILAMAKDILDAQYVTQQKLATTMLDHAIAQGGEIEAAWSKYIPVMYTSEEIKKTAKELYEFVEQKNTQE